MVKKIIIRYLLVFHSVYSTQLTTDSFLQDWKKDFPYQDPEEQSEVHFQTTTAQHNPLLTKTSLWKTIPFESALKNLRIQLGNQKIKNGQNTEYACILCYQTLQDPCYRCTSVGYENHYMCQECYDVPGIKEIPCNHPSHNCLDEHKNTALMGMAQVEVPSTTPISTKLDIHKTIAHYLDDKGMAGNNYKRYKRVCGAFTENDDHDTAYMLALLNNNSVVLNYFHLLPSTTLNHILAQVKSILKRYPDKKTVYKWRLQDAVRNNNIQVSKSLISFGLNVSETIYWRENTLLSIACQKGYPEMVNLLLKAGAYVNQLIYSSYTALYYAILHNHEQIVETLIQNDALLYIDSWEAALSNGHIEIVKKLLTYYTPLHTFYHQCNPLHIAVAQESLPIVKILIDAHVYVNKPHHKHSTPLHIAIEKQSLPIIQALIDAHADVNALDQCGHPPLLKAITQDNVKIVKLLIQNNASVNVIIEQDSLLSHALYRRNIPIIDALLKAGCNVDKDLLKYAILDTAIKKLLKKAYQAQHPKLIDKIKRFFKQ